MRGCKCKVLFYFLQIFDSYLLVYKQKVAYFCFPQTICNPMFSLDSEPLFAYFHYLIVLFSCRPHALDDKDGVFARRRNFHRFLQVGYRLDGLVVGV